MRFRVLGPVEIEAHGEVLTPPRRRERCLLAVLVLELNRTVPIGRLADLLWDGDPPERARRTIHSHVARIRGLLARAGAADHKVELVSVQGSYQLSGPPDNVDAHRFRALVDEAGGTADLASRVDRLRYALGLWRGPAFGNAASDWVQDRLCADLEERRLAAIEDVMAISLTLGREREILPELARATAEHPGRERLAELHMRALRQAGRRRDALDFYDRRRRFLAETLGLDPEPALRDLHRAILRDEPTLGTPAGGSRPVEPAHPAPDAASVAGDAYHYGPARQLVIPAQLPPDVAGFTGRVEALAELSRRLLPGAAEVVATPVVVSAIDGMAGVGKTALAVHWAHRVRDRYPDGQLYVDLRGYSPGEPMAPIDALARFLRALGILPEQVPADAEEATALYRSLLAGRHVLVLLDNAASPEQVRPLLPSSSGSAAVVTSRDQLTGLVARDGAHQLSLDVLAPEESRSLLGRILGTDRARAEPEAVAELAELCGHLPLALRIAAANLTARPRYAIGDRARHLRERGQVAALTVSGDGTSAVSAAFGLSCARLPDAARRLLRLLALVPGPDATVEAAAAIAGLGHADTESLLELLSSAHLLQERIPGRFSAHDLLRRYAAERAAQEEPETARRAALRRLYDYYLDRTDAAARAAYPSVVRLPHPEPARAAAGFDDPAAARAWLDAERDNLVAAVQHAGPDLYPRMCRIADNLRGYFWLRMDAAQWPVVSRTALAAAETLGDQRAAAAGHLSLSALHHRRGNLDEAATHASHALEQALAAGWADGEIAALTTLGSVHQRVGKIDDAADYHGQALARLDKVGKRAVLASVLGFLTIVHCQAGRLQQAAALAHRAWTTSLEFESPQGQALYRLTLGEISRWWGELDRATDELVSALELFRATGNTAHESLCLGNIAAAHRDAGRYSQALETGLAAVSLARDSGDATAHASCLTILATIQLRLGQHREARDQCQQAVELTTSARYEETEALITLAAAQLHLGELDRSIAHARRGLARCRDAGYRLLEAQALTTLATVHLAAGEVDQAVAAGERAMPLHRQAGHRLGEARTHLVLGHARQRTGDPDAARDHWRRAQAAAAGTGAPESAEAAALLTPGYYPLSTERAAPGTN